MKYLDPALRDTVDDLYDNAPCGYLATWPDGRIAGVNATLLGWLECTREDLLGKQFTDLLTAGGRIHYETHFAPLLFSVGEFDSVAIDLVSFTGERLPVFVTANVRRDESGKAVLVRVTAIDARERRAYERELVEERKRAESEHAHAQLLVRTLQRSLLPPKLLPPPGLDADAYYHTASSDFVGGDFYDLFPLSGDSWGFFLGDVCGKGSEAAVITSLTRYTLRAAAVYDSDPVAVLHNLDAVLNQEFDPSEARFCTVIFGILSRREHGFDVQLASGGHPPALMLKADGSVRYVDTPGGQLVGILPNARFVATEFRLEPGDTFVMYTDGLTEARTGRGRERYDDHGALLEFARRNSPNTAAGIVSDLRKLMESFDTGLEDDVAVMAFGMPAEEL